MKSTERFSDRVADYVRFRPHYPSGVFEFLRDELGFRRGTTIADIGSGTGISTKPLLDLGYNVFAVEPNAEMRAAAERWLQDEPQFRSVAGTAEETTLPEHSVDAVLAAQAFHWFDAAKARGEFKRILKPGGWAVLLANHRLQTQTPFLAAYERLLEEFGTDYDQVKVKGRRAIGSATLSSFFGAEKYQVRSFSNHQDLGFEELKGRLLSSSYVPKEPHPKSALMIGKLHEIFEEHSSAGTVKIMYETNIRFGQLEKQP
ncbi:MAG TPA: class I SAM-dependent methyltransferase [Pirellulales bacterium]|jgi:SAM-dependent methyltransferase|nr:class I SAM-dependent methyltransferase [Pirellulales bacterium]